MGKRVEGSKGSPQIGQSPCSCIKDKEAGFKQGGANSQAHPFCLRKLSCESNLLYRFILSTCFNYSVNPFLKEAGAGMASSCCECVGREVCVRRLSSAWFASCFMNNRGWYPGWGETGVFPSILSIIFPLLNCRFLEHCSIIQQVLCVSG